MIESTFRLHLRESVEIANERIMMDEDFSHFHIQNPMGIIGTFGDDTNEYKHGMPPLDETNRAAGVLIRKYCLQGWNLI